MRYHKVLFCLFGIIIVAAGLRFYGLAHRGLFYADETRYYRDAARAKESISSYIVQAGKKNIQGFLGALTVTDKNSSAAKPGHSFLGLIGLYVFGSHQYSVLFMSGLLGVASVILAFCIGQRFYDTKTGLLAALMLAVCPAHILFSRSFLSHSNQAFFILLGSYLYLVSLRPLAALCLGYSFLIHPSALIYFAPFLAYEVFSWIKRERRFISVLNFCVLFLAPFFILEAVFIFGKKEFGSLAVALKDSYADQLLYMNSDAALRGIETNRVLGIWHYLVMNVLVNGIAFTTVLILGILFGVIYAFKRKRPADMILIVFPVLLLIYWQFFARHERLFREIVFLFPYLCIMAAVFLSRFSRTLAVLLACVIVLGGVRGSAGVIVHVRSHYPRIERFLAENKITKIITPSEYLAGTADVLMPDLKDLKIYRITSINEVKGLIGSTGAGYLMVLPGDWLQSAGFRLKIRPVLRVPEPNYAYFPAFYEGVRREDLRYKDEPDAVCIGIYKIRGADL